MVFFLSFSLSKFLVHFSYWRSNRLCCLHCKTDNLRLVFSPLQYVDRLGKGRRNLFSFSSSSPFSSSFHITPSSPANLLSPGNNEMGIMQRGEKREGLLEKGGQRVFLLLLLCSPKGGRHRASRDFFPFFSPSAHSISGPSFPFLLLLLLLGPISSRPCARPEAKVG